MKFFKLPIYALAAALITTPTIANAWWWHWDDDDDEDIEIPFEVAEIFFELNDTDGDLGLHADVDGDPWKKLEMEDPNGRSLLKVNLRGRLRRQGLTEFSFESAEPKFVAEEEGDETLDPEVFFGRFPEGEYEVEGTTLDGGELESEVELSHVIPAAPDVASVGDSEPPEEEGECWSEVDGTVDVVVDWDEVMLSHKEKHSSTGPEPRDISLGIVGPIDVINYEFVAEIDGSDFKSTAIVPPGTTAWTIPGEFIALALGVMVENDDEELELVDEIKFEILVRVDNGDGNPGNKSAVESCFETNINEEAL